MKVTTAVERISPELAASYIRLNTSNRPLSKTVVNKYANALKRGEWNLTGEPIIFSESGVLADGQHRLHACVQSGMPFDTLVVRGIPDEAFDVMNTGKSRGAGDVLALKGHKNYVHLAAGAKAILRYEARHFGLSPKAFSNPQVVACVEAHPDLHEWSRQVHANKSNCNIPASVSGFLTLVSESYGMDSLTEFAHTLLTGENGKRGDPALVLRNSMVSGRNGSKMSTEAIDTYVCKALDAHVRGETIGLLRYRADHAFPLIGGVDIPNPTLIKLTR